MICMINATGITDSEIKCHVPQQENISRMTRTDMFHVYGRLLLKLWRRKNCWKIQLLMIDRSSCNHMRVEYNTLSNTALNVPLQSTPPIHANYDNDYNFQSEFIMNKELFLAEWITALKFLNVAVNCTILSKTFSEKCIFHLKRFRSV